MKPADDAELTEAYRLTFSGDNGEAVLDDLLDVCGFWISRPGDAPFEAHVKKKIGSYLLLRMGALHRSNREKLVSLMANLPPEEVKT